jgi:hypothetical protein
MSAESIIGTPWDAVALGCDTYEIRDVCPEVLDQIHCRAGHYTARLQPLASKQLLLEHGFYYCDTLIEPYCGLDQFIAHPHPDAAFSRSPNLPALLAICHGGFAYDRFHRDPGVQRQAADARYDNWLIQLHEKGDVYGLLFCRELVGFIAVSANRLALHAMSYTSRDKGYARHLWSGVCNEMFSSGCTELVSSISAANLAAVNLYAGLGFRFRNSLDVYHRVVK